MDSPQQEATVNLFHLPSSILASSQQDRRAAYQRPGLKRAFEDRSTLDNASNEFQVQLLSARTTNASLESQLRALRMELEETKVKHEKELTELRLTNKTTTSRNTTLETELSFMWNKENELRAAANQAKKDLETLKAEFEVQRVQFHNNLSACKQEHADFEAHANTTIRELKGGLTATRQQMLDLQNTNEALTSQLRSVKERNEHLYSDLNECREKCSLAEFKAQELEVELAHLKEECKLALTQSEDLKTLNRVKNENKVLNLQCQRYKNLSQNTLLLQEEKQALQERCENLRKLHESLMVENEALKQSMLNETASTNYESVDRMSRQVAKLTEQELSLTERLKQAEDELRICRQLSETQSSTLATQLAEVQQDLLNERQKCSTMEEAWRKCISDLETYKIEVEKLQGQLQMQIATQERIKSEATNLQQIMEADTAKIAMLESRTTQLTADLDNDRERFAQTSARYEQEINELRSKNAQTGAGVDQAHLDYDPSAIRVVHTVFNPYQDARLQHAKDVDELTKENAVLRLRVEEFERARAAAAAHADNIAAITAQTSNVADDVTRRVFLRQVEDQHQLQITALHAEVQKSNEHLQRSKEQYRALAKAFREMTAKLTGYQIKLVEEHQEQQVYLVRSMFEPPNEYFQFRKVGSDLQLLENEYALRWADFVEMYLQTDNSIPAFLSAATLQLYSRNKDSNAANDTATGL